MSFISRRNFTLSAVSAALVALLQPGRASAFPFLPFSDKAAKEAAKTIAKTLTLCNLHTGETCAATYWEDGSYNTEGLQAFNKLLRDHRTGEVISMDPSLFDLLHSIAQKTGAKEIQVVSGYRSPKTNAMLRKNSSGVAKKSLHMQGRAIDIRVPGVALAKVRDTALAQKKGGVGYYKGSNFIHLDTGRVRRWNG